METTKTKTSAELEDAVRNEGKNTAMIAYLTFIGLIIAFVMNNENKNEFATYHIRQSLGLVCVGIVIGIVGMIPILGWIVSILGSLALIYLWIVGIMNAINQKKQPVPWIGDKFEEWFKSI